MIPPWVPSDEVVEAFLCAINGPTWREGFSAWAVAYRQDGTRTGLVAALGPQIDALRKAGEEMMTLIDGLSDGASDAVVANSHRLWWSRLSGMTCHGTE